MYARAVIYNPNTDKYLFAHFPNATNITKWGLVGGKLESGDYQKDLMREIQEETGFTTVQACVRLGGLIYSPRDPEFDTEGIIKVNILFLVILDPSQTPQVQTLHSQSEQQTGLNLQWLNPGQVIFDGYYKQNQVMLDRAIQVIAKIRKGLSKLG